MGRVDFVSPFFPPFTSDKTIPEPTNNKRIKSTTSFLGIFFHLFVSYWNRFFPLRREAKTTGPKNKWKKKKKNSKPSHEKPPQYHKKMMNTFFFFFERGGGDLIPIMSFSFFLIRLFQQSTREKRWGTWCNDGLYITQSHAQDNDDDFSWSGGGRGDRKSTAVPIASSSSSITRNPIFWRDMGKTRHRTITFLLFSLSSF